MKYEFKIHIPLCNQYLPVLTDALVQKYEHTKTIKVDSTSTRAIIVYNMGAKTLEEIKDLKEIFVTKIPGHLFTKRDQTLFKFETNLIIGSS